MIYVYAIVEGWAGSARGVPGIAGTPLRATSDHGLTAVYSDEPARDLEPTAEALLQHERVLEALMEDHAVLPLRFASTLQGERELRDLLASRHDEFAAALASVRGRVELGVRAISPAPLEGAPTSGRAYLTAKLERRRAAARIGEAIHAELAPLASDSNYRLAGDPKPTFAGAYLVDRDQVDRFRRAFEAARTSRPHVELACTGPWPPFSFTEPKETA